MQDNDHNYSSIPSTSDPAVRISLNEEPLNSTYSADSTLKKDDFTILLLEERLNVERQRRKVGEVVVRREVETRIIEVPVRREKLVVEQINPEYRQIASIDLASGELSAPAQFADTHTAEQTLKASYLTLRDASHALAAIASELETHCLVNVSLLLHRAEFTERSTHRFVTATTARQMLEAIAAAFSTQCQQVDLEIVAKSDTLPRVYETWVQQRNSSSSALAGARNFSLS